MCGTFVGTFKYMSPERMKSERYSYSSDVWSLGLVLMECATGEFPYRVGATTVETTRQSNPLETLSTSSGSLFVDMDALCAWVEVQSGFFAHATTPNSRASEQLLPPSTLIWVFCVLFGQGLSFAP